MCLLFRARNSRHTFASRLTRNGADPLNVMDPLGHSTVPVSKHSNDKAKRRALGKPPTNDKVVTVVPRPWNRAVNESWRGL